MKGIGKKSYEQCAGFLKVLPDQSTIQKNDSNSVIIIDSDDNDDNDCQVISYCKRKHPQTSRNTKRTKLTPPDYNHLDATLIHPESYGIAEK